MKILLAIALGASLPLSSMAQQENTTPPTPPASIPDFAEGFTRLAALGMPMPDPKASWTSSRNAEISYIIRRNAPNLKGNAWLLATPQGNPPQLLPLGSVTPSSDPPSASKPDLAKDVATLIKAIHKAAANNDEYKSSELINNTYGSSGAEGELLLFATQLHMAGHPQLANELANALFTSIPSRESAIDAAINHYADTLLSETTSAFFASYDWTSYERSLTNLSTRFPRGWTNRDAVALLLPQLAKQNAGLIPPQPTLKDIPIDPRALTAIDSWNTPAQANDKPAPRTNLSPYSYPRESNDAIPSLWLLAEPTDPSPNSTPAARLTALGMAAIPALASLIGDPFLIPSPAPTHNSRTYYSNSSDEDQLLERYRALQRPATRGEIARSALLATLPDPENELDESDDESLRESALEFWRNHQNATREQLAAAFLSQGSTSQASAAANILASSTNPDAHRIFENHVLNLESAASAVTAVQVYLRTRKAAAKPFFDAYAKQLREQTKNSGTSDENSYENDWIIEQAGGTEKFLKSLAAFVNPVAPRALAVQIAKGKPADAPEAISNLTSQLDGLPPLKQLHALLEGANAATNAKVRCLFLLTSLNIEWDEENPEQEENPNTEESDSPKPDRQPQEAESKVWRKLIADTRKIKADDLEDDTLTALAARYQLQFNTVSDIARMTFEQSLNPTFLWDWIRCFPAIGDDPMQLLIARTDARLANQTPTALPNADNVPPERLAAIVAATATLELSAIHPHLKSLTPDERAAWINWLENPGDISIPDPVKSLRATVITRFAGNQTLPDPAHYTSLLPIGFHFAPSTLLTDLAAHLKNAPGPTLIYTSPTRLGPGIELAEAVVILDPPTPNKDQPSKETPPQETPATPDASTREDTAESSSDQAATDGSDDTAGESDEDEEDSPPQDPLDNWRPTFKNTLEALDDNPEATACIELRAQSSDNRTQLLFLLDKEGKFSLHTPEDTPEAADLTTTLKETLNPDTFPVRIQIHMITREQAAKLTPTGNSDD